MMNSLQQFDDLENHFLKLTAVVNHFEKSQQNQKNYAIVIEKLSEDVENLRESNKSLNRQVLLSGSYSEEENRIHTFYVNLKEKFNQLERSYFNLEKKHVFIEQTHMLNIIQLEERFEREKESLKREHFEKSQTMMAKIEQEKLERYNLETQHQNELRIVQAASAVQIDDTESRRQLELREANHKIEELQCLTNSMRDELFQLRRINAENKQVNVQLEQKLVILREEVHKHKNRNIQYQTNYSVEDFASTSLQECIYSNEDSDNHKISENVNSVTKRRVLNPLNSSVKQHSPKKRRLFNPNSLDYLKDLEQPR